MRYRPKKMYHEAPGWVADGADFFITVCVNPRGENQLCVPRTALGIYESLAFRQRRKELWVHLLLLMPDHLHAIVSFSAQTGMSKSITNWKRYTACQFGIHWQRDFFDHRLRKDESYIEKAHYIRMNPVRAGLVDQTDAWPYVWESCRGDFR